MIHYIIMRITNLCIIAHYWGRLAAGNHTDHVTWQLAPGYRSQWEHEDGKKSVLPSSMTHVFCLKSTAIRDAISQKHHTITRSSLSAIISTILFTLSHWFWYLFCTILNNPPTASYSLTFQEVKRLHFYNSTLKPQSFLTYVHRLSQQTSKR